jgi:hypothetical protein
MKRQAPAHGTAARDAEPRAHAASATHVAAIPAAVLHKLGAWCEASAPHRACASLRQAISLYRRARGSREEAPAAKVVAALYLLLVSEGDPLTAQERLGLEDCLQPALDASRPAA